MHSVSGASISWFQAALQPYEHYLPVRHDLADLQDAKLPFGGAYFRDPHKYNYRFTFKLLVFAGIPEHSIFLFILQMGGSRCVQNTPAGCGNNLPTRLGNHISDKKYVLMPLLLIITCVLQSVPFFYVSDKVPQAK